MKTNFKLSSKNAHIFIHRIKCMLNRFGYMSSHGIYPVAKKLGKLAPTYFSDGSETSLVTESCKSYFSYRSSFDIIAKGVRLNFGDEANGMIIPFGTKVKFTSNRIIFKGHLFSHKGTDFNHVFIETIKPANRSEAERSILNQIEEAQQYDAQCWSEMEEEML